ncbi:HAD-IA family hydrolase [Martelella alba]|uniref:HAD-IA family hydrolase n=1 Tax=Martelella alba TaxID=2590451 RepID=A0A506UIP0_9HYPH|nr:HAD-IA family hydrolase [Martelella alba]TPW33133.1 HAD-IA family hydrolase [Martelella alba]
MKLVLFDCDGTLVDSLVIIQETMRRTFLDFGYAAPAVEATRATVGLTLDVAIAGLLDKPAIDEEARAMMAHYRSLFSEVRADPSMQESLFEGIADVLERLFEEDEILIGAVTGKSRRGLNHMLDVHNWFSRFPVTRTADDCPSKPHPAMVLECCSEAGIDPADTTVIGDAVFDMQMARSAGARALGVSWGYGQTDALMSAGAERILTSPNDILVQLIGEDHARPFEH